MLERRSNQSHAIVADAATAKAGRQKKSTGKDNAGREGVYRLSSLTLNM
jgi:5-hydroxyisourate hydrolase-like protein (transthyretin family)